MKKWMGGTLTRWLSPESYVWQTGRSRQIAVKIPNPSVSRAHYATGPRYRCLLWRLFLLIALLFSRHTGSEPAAGNPIIRSAGGRGRVSLRSTSVVTLLARR